MDSRESGPSTVAGEHLARNIETIAEVHAHQEHGVGRHQKFVERLNEAIGRPRSLYWVLSMVILWIAWNLASPALGHAAFDPPPFSLLQGGIALSALLMTIMILTTQKRQVKHAEQRAQLDLQVNLRAEQKIAKLIQLVEELRRDLPNVRNRVDAVADAMTKEVDPHEVMSHLEHTFEAPSDQEPKDDPSVKK